jgi:gliding motility-associated-like protein
MKKRILYSLTSLFLIGLMKMHAQFWTESFGTGCNQLQVPNAGLNPGGNGAWSVANTGANGANANSWYISATEAGMGLGNCGDGCLATPGLINRSLHIGNIANPLALFCTTGDCGSLYLAGAGFNTDKRAESPIINCTGQNNITLSFSYFVEGIPNVDFCEVMYFNGVVWASLGPLAQTANNANCPSPFPPIIPDQGFWTAFSVALPASANNNANVRVGFRWINTDPTGQDPSVAIDDVALSVTAPTVTPTFTIPASACAGANVPLTTTAVATNYTWSVLPAGPVIGSANVQNTNIVFPNAGTFTVTCAAGSPTPVTTFTQAITINAAPALTITPGSPVNTCAGNPALLTASGATSYTWLAPPLAPLPTVISTNATVAVTPTANTTYTVLGSTATCTAFGLVQVVLSPNLSIGVTPVSPSVCPGGTIQLTASNATTYTWVAPGNNTISAGPATVAITQTAATTYTVYGAAAGCSGTGTVLVGMSPSFPLIVVASSPTTCPGAPVILSAGGATTYTWLPAATLSSPNGATVTATPSTSTTYTVNGTLNGCNGSGTISISTLVSPPVTIAATASAICQNYQATLTANSAASYTWSGTPLSGTFVPVFTNSISVFAGTYTVVGSNGGVCSSTATIKIDTLPPLNISVSLSSPTTCIIQNSTPNNVSAPVTLIASGASNYQWSPPCPSFLNLCVGGTVAARPWTTSTVQVIGTTASCSGTAVITVSVIPQFTIAVVPIAPITCLGSCINFTITGTGTNVPGPLTYSWTESANALATLSNPLSRTPVACPTVNTTYTAVAIDNRGCISAPRLVTMTILPVPLGTITIPTNTICFVGNIVGTTSNTLNLGWTNGNPGLPNGVVPTYTWSSPSVGQILTNFNAPNVIITPISTASPIIFTLTMGYNGISGCSDTTTVKITVLDCRKVIIPTFTTVTARDTLCAGNCITFTNTTAAAHPQIVKWSFPGGTPNTSTLQAPNVCYNLPGKFNVTLTSYNAFNAVGSPTPGTGYQNYITVVDVPNPLILPIPYNVTDTTVQFGSQIVLTGTNATWYVWQPANANVSCNYCTTTTIKAYENMQVTLEGYNSRGCKGTYTLNIIVIPDCGEMFVPNAFSPNNDKANDVLYVRGKCLETLKFQVFNRWGQLVFETTDQDKGWDGTFNGDIMNTGVFVYRLEGKGYDGKGYSFKGNVTLIR